MSESKGGIGGRKGARTDGAKGDDPMGCAQVVLMPITRSIRVINDCCLVVRKRYKVGVQETTA